MAITKTINFSQFCDEWNKWEDRKDTFSYEGKRALFDHLDQYSEDMGGDIELDIIALCCDFSEYESFKELQVHYPDIESIDDLENETIVLKLDNGGLIIQDF